MTTQLPQIHTLSSTGVFLKLLQDGVTVAGQISKIKADIHLTNSGKVSVEFTLRSMADTVKVGSSRIFTLVPGQTTTISFDDWFNRVEFLADGVTSVMVRGTSNAQFGFSLRSRVPGTEAGVGTIDSTTPPFDYPQGQGSATLDLETGLATYPSGHFIYLNAPESSSSSSSSGV